MPEILVDADACPVKQEIYQVAKRYGLTVTLVSNSWMRTPNEDWIILIAVEGQLDAVDDWIAQRAGENDIVITSDIPLASRCLDKGAHVLDCKGGRFTEERIGDALAGRELASHFRDIGIATSGPAPFEKRDRSHFLQRLDQTIQGIRSQKSQR